MLNLNEDQLKAKRKILRWWKKEGSGKIFRLTGPAGTGKTFCVSWIIYELAKEYGGDRKFRVDCVAPTHKARKVLGDSIFSSLDEISSDWKSYLNIEVRTLHRAFGGKPSIQLDGKQDFHSSRSGYRGEWREDIDQEKSIDQTTDLLIADESSMISEKWVNAIEEDFLTYCEYKTKDGSIRYRYPGKILYLGDRHQLPPVKEKCSKALPDDGAWSDNNPTRSVLQKVERSLNPNLLNMLDIIRDNIDNPNLLSICKGKFPEFFFRKDQFEELLPQFFGSDFDQLDCKVIAYRNRVVDCINDAIRIRKWGSQAVRRSFLEGEKLYFKEPGFVPCRREKDINSEDIINFDLKAMSYDEIEVEESRVIEKYPIPFPKFSISSIEEAIETYGFYPQDLPADRRDLMKVIQLKTKPLEGYLSYEFLTPYYLSEKNKRLSFLAEKAKSFKERYDKVKGKSKEKQKVIIGIGKEEQREDIYYETVTRIYWKYYWMVRNVFSTLKYSYALTANAAQGSGFTKVIARADDIFDCNSVFERNRRFYVACSRAKTDLAVVT